MPTLNWIGKSDVQDHHKTIPYKVLEKDKKLSIGNTKNMLIQGDNLLALKSLLPYYKGKIKCIYIDPPYNTGNESWIYNDKVNSPTIQEWLNKTVGKPDEDLSMHDKWLCMMYPRLYLLRELLADDGVIFISIDDNELANLKQLCDEIFNEKNFIANIIVNVNRSGRRYREIAINQEYILCYGKTSDIKLNQIPKDTIPKYQDDIGNYDLVEIRNRNPKFTRNNRPNLYYPIYIDPTTFTKYKECSVSLTNTAKHTIQVYPRNSKGEDDCWRWGKEKFQSNNDENPQLSQVVAKQRRDQGWNIYKKDRNTTTKIKSIWDEKEVRTEQGTIELKDIFHGEVFPHPKPVELISKCIRLVTSNNDIILDSFAGSGTTAQAVMELNKQDGGNRKFILIEMESDIAQDITHKRLVNVIEQMTN